MNHYINLLEARERRPVQTMDAAKYVKPLVFVVVALVAAGVFWFYRVNTEVVREAQRLSRQWSDMEPRVEEAQARTEVYDRLLRSRETLLGWSASRYPWSEILAHTRDAIPEPRGQFQFLDFSFDEEIRGLRSLPRDSEAAADPLERQVDIRLVGRIQAERPDRHRFELEDRLRGSQTHPSPFVSVTLENPPVLPEPPPGPLPVSGFQFTLTLPPATFQAP